MGCTPAVVGDVGERGALDRLTAAGTLDGCRVDQEQIIAEARALAGEDAHQPLDRVGQPAPTLKVRRLGRDLGEETAKALAGDLEKPSVTRDSHDRLRDTEGDHLRVGEHSACVARRLGKEIVRRAINRGAEKVEVGVHRGLLVDGVLSTADFGLSASNPSNTATAVESLI